MVNRLSSLLMVNRLSSLPMDNHMHNPLMVDSLQLIHPMGNLLSVLMANRVQWQCPDNSRWHIHHKGNHSNTASPNRTVSIHLNNIRSIHLNNKPMGVVMVEGSVVLF